jgi:ethanolamine utilization protein EutS
MMTRIIMESVPGRQITLAHVIANPDPILYRKLGLDPNIDYHNAAIGILCQTPYETAIITADIALKAAAIQLGFVDRFSGTLVVTGSISDVTIAWEHVLEYAEKQLQFDICPITKA